MYDPKYEWVPLRLLQVHMKQTLVRMEETDMSFRKNIYSLNLYDPGEKYFEMNEWRLHKK